MRGDTLLGHEYRHEGVYILIKKLSYRVLLLGLALGYKIFNSLTHYK